MQPAGPRAGGGPVPVSFLLHLLAGVSCPCVLTQLDIAVLRASLKFSCRPVSALPRGLQGSPGLSSGPACEGPSCPQAEVSPFRPEIHDFGWRVLQLTCCVELLAP